MACRVRAWCVHSACLVRACAAYCMCRILHVCMVRACAGGLREGSLEEGEVVLQRKVLNRLDRNDEDGDRVDDVGELVALRERADLLVARGSICGPIDPSPSLPRLPLPNLPTNVPIYLPMHPST